MRPPTVASTSSSSASGRGRSRARQPHPPVLVGGNGPRVLDRVLAFGDEWMPNILGDPDKLVARIRELQTRAEDAGRPPIPVTFLGLPLDPAVLDKLADGGVHRGVFWLPVAGRDRVEARVDDFVRTIEAYRQAGG